MPAINMQKQMAMGMMKSKKGPSGISPSGIKLPMTGLTKIGSTKSAPGMKASPPTGKGGKIK